MTPKIRWYAQKDVYGHLITAEISLGSARYKEILLGVFSSSEECAYLHNRKNAEEYGGCVE